MAKASRKMKKEIADKIVAYRNLEEYLKIERQKEDKSEYLISELESFFRRLGKELLDWIKRT